VPLPAGARGRLTDEELADRLDTAWSGRLRGVDARVSIALRSASASVASRDASASHYAASTIKLAVLGAWLETGRTDDLLVHAEFASATGGRFAVLQSDDQDDETWAALGTALGSAVLARRMIQLSGNLATDLLAEAVGLDAVAAYLERAGLAAALSMRRLIGDAAAETAGITNSVTAAGLAELLSALACDPGALGMLAGQRHRNLIPAGLPDGTWTASKSGWVPGVRHDVALVRPGGAPEYVLAVCTSGSADDEAELMIKDLSRLTYEEWMRWHA
jgi:beta-lactamase class A